MSGGGNPYQKHNWNVEEECNHGVSNQVENTSIVDVVHGDRRHLSEERSKTVHNSADGSEVIQGDKRVHLELRGAEQALHHDKTGSFENNSCDLVDESNEDELNLSEGGDDNTDNDEGDVEQGLHVRRSDSQKPSSDENSNRSSSLLKNNCEKQPTRSTLGPIAAAIPSTSG